MEILKILLVFVIGYLLGSLNASLLIGKMYGMDVRKHGSGNAGMTNTLRTLGKLPAILVTIGDILKGVVACILGSMIIDNALGVQSVGFLIAGVAAVIGHNWPVFFGFKGGKGILTTFAVILMMQWKIGLILLAIFIIIVFITRYISVGSVVASLSFPLIAYMYGDVFLLDFLFVICAMILSALAVWRHVPNIKRLMNGTENKFSLKSFRKTKGVS